MAELTDPNLAPTVSGCCSPAAQETCCEPSEKSACCETSAAGGSCGCAAGRGMLPAADELRETVRERYAAAAVATSDPAAVAGCCENPAAITDEQAELFGAGLYSDGEHDELPDTALFASLGCGNPTAMADLNSGEVVLDLGLRRRHRRAALGPPRRPHRHRLRARHDRRDARARQGQPGQGRRRERALAQGAHRGDPAPGRDRRRRALQLRHQPLDRQAAGPARSRTRAQTRRALRGLRRDRRPRHGRRHPRRHAAVRRLRRRRAHPRRVRTPPRRRRPRPRSRSPRPTASTSTQGRRSSAHANLPDHPTGIAQNPSVGSRFPNAKAF